VDVKPILLVLSGLMGSGKSTRALSWVDEDPANRERLNYDTLRLEMFGPDWVFNRVEENAMKTEGTARVVSWLNSGKSVVIDNTNLTAPARMMWRVIGRDLGIDVVEEELDTPVEVCVARDRARAGQAQVGRAVIERAALDHGFLDLNDYQLYPKDFLIVDMDGTIADCGHRRKTAALPFVHKVDCTHTGDVVGANCPQCGARHRINWDVFYDGIAEDPVISPIVDLVVKLADVRGSSSNYDILIVSGRPIDKAGKATEAWLSEHAPFPVRHLLMRKGGDSRPDFVVKQEILDKLSCTPRIRYTIDDRNQVVQMWRKNGLTCLQVADGDF
jgi:predicted kinase